MNMNMMLSYMDCCRRPLDQLTISGLPRNHRQHLTIVMFLVCRFIISVDPQCDLLRTMSMTEDAAIDRLYTLQRLVHCTHTTEFMASCSHSGGPTTFRQNQSIA